MYQQLLEQENMEIENKALSISGIVRKDYRTADVFKKHGINYCCGGNSTLEEICRLQNLDLNSLQNELEKATNTVVVPASLRFDEWNIDFLVDYIINVHHAYLKHTLPALDQTLEAFVRSHRNKFSFLDQLLETYKELAELLLEHTAEEEKRIFPYIRQISHTHKHKESYGHLFVKTLSKSLAQVLQSDHKHIAAHLIQLRNITNQYQFSSNACTTHQVVFQKLKELDADIVQHKHLENNVLFPKAINMENELLNY